MRKNTAKSSPENNKFTDTVREFAKKLSDDDFRYLHIRLTYRVGPDVGEAVEFLQKFSELDQWFDLTKSASELFDMVDSVDFAIQSEAKRRTSLYEKERVNQSWR
jgi:hypothetical protein